MRVQNSIIEICKALIVSYLVTTIMLLLFALALWKLDFSQDVLKGASLVLYILSAGIGGFYIGKKQKEKKFLWGMLLGASYFLVMFLITVLTGGFFGSFGIHFFTTLFICVMSGTLGGMVA